MYAQEYLEQVPNIRTIFHLLSFLPEKKKTYPDPTFTSNANIMLNLLPITHLLENCSGECSFSEYPDE